MQTRRFHVSGITPAISTTELATRFAAFGTVKAIDGLGALDGLGQPRKFAYLTLEATPDKFSKCLNTLSGSMWKGTKLRIGDSKPDYLQRLEHDRMTGNRVSSKRPRVSPGRESRNMDLVTLDNVHSRAGWKRTSLSHLVRPIRMRPLHPIDRPVSNPVSIKRRRKKASRILTRLRRQKIDPTQFGAIHLTEAMLQADVITVQPTLKPTSNGIVSSFALSKEESDAIAEERIPAVPPSAPEPQDEFQLEKARDLDIISRLFGGKDEWEAKETDFENQSSEGGIQEDDKELAERVSSPASSTPSDAEQSDESSEHSIHHVGPPPSTTTTTRLKDLFIGRPPPESTSILAGLDLELEDDLVYGSMPDVNFQDRIPTETAIYTKGDKGTRTELGNLDFSTSVPYFFPLNPEDTIRGGTKDIFTISQAQGWTRELTNPVSSEDVRARWEAQKVGLTKSWKQRHREAVKRQRRGGAVDVLE